MAISSGLKKKFEDAHDDLVAKLDSLQSDYRARHGKYLQVLATTDPLPEDGSTVEQILDRKPGTQPETPAEAGLDLSTREVGHAVHEVGGDDPGYIVITRTVEAGVQYVRRDVFGTGAATSTEILEDDTP